MSTSEAKKTKQNKTSHGSSKRKSRERAERAALRSEQERWKLRALGTGRRTNEQNTD